MANNNTTEYGPKPTERELELLQEFREIISDLNLREEEKTDDALLKWLRAREYDTSEANQMLRRSSQWRMENDIYNLLYWRPPEYFFRDYKYDICGYTSTGCPIITGEFGKWDIRKVAESKDRDQWLKYFDLLCAQLDDRMKKYSQSKRSDPGAVIETQFVGVADVGGFSMRQITSMSTISLMRELVRRYEANYPETLKVLYVVNTSRVFQWLYNLIKPLLTARTLSKFRILGTNEEQWKEVLLENIPSDQLGVRFGGTFKPDESGTKKKIPETVPEENETDEAESETASVIVMSRRSEPVEP